MIPSPYWIRHLAKSLPHPKHALLRLGSAFGRRRNILHHTNLEGADPRKSLRPHLSSVALSDVVRVAHLIRPDAGHCQIAR